MVRGIGTSPVFPRGILDSAHNLWFLFPFCDFGMLCVCTYNVCVCVWWFRCCPIWVRAGLIWWSLLWFASLFWGFWVAIWWIGADPCLIWLRVWLCGYRIICLVSLRWPWLSTLGKISIHRNGDPGVGLILFQSTLGPGDESMSLAHC